jgi:hypothetical protein
MHRPVGIAVTNNGYLWVAEQDEAPRRVSIWKTDGEFVKALYGPVHYGGGGKLDPENRTRFYYARMDYGTAYANPKTKSTLWRAWSIQVYFDWRDSRRSVGSPIPGSLQSRPAVWSLRHHHVNQFVAHPVRPSRLLLTAA